MKKGKTGILLLFVALAAALVFRRASIDAGESSDVPSLRAGEEIAATGGALKPERALSPDAVSPPPPGDLRDTPGDINAGKPELPQPASAIVFETRTFKLAKAPDYGRETALTDILSASYDTTVSNHSGDGPMDAGFTYSLAPTGVVYSFSEIEVACILQVKDAGISGPAICEDFFRELGDKIKRVLPG